MKLINLIFVLLFTSSLFAAEDVDEVLETQPKIILHDILTNNVCVYESKIYSVGSRIIMMEEEYICDIKEGGYGVEPVPKWKKAGIGQASN